MIVDVPEFRRVFDEECRVDFSKLFLDGTARPKIVTKTSSSSMDNTESESSVDIHVVQKSLVKSLTTCGQRNKTILLEASMANINPRQMKRRYEFQRRRRRRPPLQPSSTARKQPLDNDDDDVSNENKTNSDNHNDNDNNNVVGSDENTIRPKSDVSFDDDVRDEEDAPWNQKAWMEEMDLRISGKVPFSSSMEPSSYLSRLVFGNHYRTTVPASSSWWWTTNNTRSLHKPHAVIADAATFSLVPGSLRLLSRCCREADVPLYVVKDPRGRSWAESTHDDVPKAARALRRNVKRRIVARVWQSRQRRAFERGKRWGTTTTRLEYESRAIAARAKRVWTATKERMRTSNNSNSNYDNDDWSEYDEDKLREEFIKRKLMSVSSSSSSSSDKETTTTTTNDNDGSGTKEPDPQAAAAAAEIVVASKGLLELCQSIMRTSTTHKNTNGSTEQNATTTTTTSTNIEENNK